MRLQMATQPTPRYECQKNAFFFQLSIAQCLSFYPRVNFFFTRDCTFPPFKCIFTMISLGDGRQANERPLESRIFVCIDRGGRINSYRWQQNELLKA